ncbi:MAG: hypothetical protein JNK05_25545 [Myxococcales bacterium]|nr:hypothetical protein [Myxococcales bacterium]
MTHTISAAFPPVVEGKQEFEATRAEREAITNPEKPTFDIASAVILVASSMAGIEPHVTELEKMGLLPVGLFARLPVIGSAAVYAAHQERAAKSENVQHGPLVDELDRTLARFQRNAVVLVEEGRLDRTILTTARTGTTVRDRAMDLGTLSVEFSDNFERIHGATAITSDDIARASKLSHEILASLATRNEVSEAQQAATRDRQLAAVLLLRSWDKIRRAMTWQRWEEGDADTLAPSFFRHDNTRKSSGRDSEPAKPVEPAPLPEDKREENERASNNGSIHGVPQDDPFVR